jgi:uncharacterized protein (TIGR00255 family)
MGAPAERDVTVIRSMTGYGRGEVRSAAGNLAIEMRSVNNRYLDVQIKLPRSLNALEPRIRKMVQEGFSRGRVDVFITRSGADASPFKFIVDHERAEQYIGALKELKTRFSLPGEVDLALLNALPDIIGKEEITEDLEQLWTALGGCLGQAIESLRSMREQEGSSLAQDIAGRLDAIEALTKAVWARTPLTVEQARKRMTEALEKILKDPPEPARLAQEIAILAERTDVTEEITRLGSHMNQFRAMVHGAGAEPVGRKLDFLIQEMGREVNTIASKALDAEISLQVVNMKAELEKIREQVQNIE